MLNLKFEFDGTPCDGRTAYVLLPFGRLDGVSHVAATLVRRSRAGQCGPDRVTPATIASNIFGFDLKPAARPLVFYERPAP